MGSSFRSAARRLSDRVNCGRSILASYTGIRLDIAAPLHSRSNYAPEGIVFDQCL